MMLSTFHTGNLLMTASQSKTSWSQYYQKVATRPPRQLLLQAVERFPSPGTAIDLGCGGGTETRELLHRGWQVIAIDQEAAAFDHLLAHITPLMQPRLTTLCSPFAHVTLPPADLLWAGLSLPFCPPSYFPHLWTQIEDCLRPDGRFAGDLFGVHHVWHDNHDLTFVTREQVEMLLHNFVIEQLEESEEERQTAFEGMQHWHGFAIIARKLGVR
jgi:SAM-dependent methyltransferase